MTAKSSIPTDITDQIASATADKTVGTKIDNPSDGHIPGDSERPVTVIRAKSTWWEVDWAELWRYREVLYFLIWRDVKVRYKQTVVGAAWAILQPAATTLVFSLFFGRVAEMPTAGVPYPIYALCGLLLWGFIATSVTSGALSLISNQSLITKIYFPRIYLPLAPIGIALLDFGIACSLLALMMAWYGFIPNISIILAPAVILLGILMVVGVSLFLSALAAFYRDVRHVLPFFIQLWMFATPSIYMDARFVGPRLTAILPLNPAYGIISAFRSVMLNLPIDGYAISVSSAVTICLLVLGWCYFRYVERTFADVI